MRGTPLNFSEAAGLALHTVDYLAQHGEALVSTGEIAAALGVSEHHLAKVHQRLARAGIIAGTRGPGGGFRLARDADAIRLLEVYEAVEGPLPAMRCLLGRAECEKPGCILGGLVAHVEDEVRTFLSDHTVGDLSRPAEVPA